MILTTLLFTLIFLLVAIAAICNKLMDKWMTAYALLTDMKEEMLNPKWASFNPRAKWEIVNVLKADNIFFKKLGWKTKWLSDVFNDGWHTCKSAMIVCLLSTPAISLILGAKIGYVNAIFYTSFVGILGFIWNFTFSKYKKSTFK